MPRLKLQPSPTFTAVVEVPMHGGAPDPVKFTFKHRPREQFLEWLKGLREMPDVEMLESILSGWELEEPFGRESIELLVKNYMGAPRVILDKYMTENGQAALGNFAG